MTTRFLRPLFFGRLLLLPVAMAPLLAGGAGCVHARATPPPPEAIAPTKPDHERAVETGIPVASTPQGLLREGAEKRIQTRLHAKGLLRSEQVTGQLDNDTRLALRKFQKSEGLPTTGLPSYETVERLGLNLDHIFHTTPRPRDPTLPAHGREAGAGGVSATTLPFFQRTSPTNWGSPTLPSIRASAFS